MVPKHLLQLIFLSVICISSFKILELRFRYELYDSNEILGKNGQRSIQRLDFSQKWAVWAMKAARLRISATLLKNPTTFGGVFSHFHGKKI